MAETVQQGNVTITLSQSPYLQGDGNANWYEASGQGSDGNDYLVRWEILPGGLDREDESESCDWTQYTVLRLGSSIDAAH